MDYCLNLKDFFKRNNKVALAYSGGTDSTFLLYAAKKYGATCQPFYLKSSFQPAFELKEAKEHCRLLALKLKIIEVDILSHKEIAANPPERCYLCKKLMFTRLLAAAKAEGFSLIIDGTNASDQEDERPGMRALEELSIRSPLRECGLTKEKVRLYSKKMGLSTWNKPPYACLATRFPAGKVITKDELLAVEQGEAFLKSLGFTNLRLRLFHGVARLQLPKKELALAIKNREAILGGLKEFFPTVLLDLEPRD